MGCIAHVKRGHEGDELKSRAEETRCSLTSQTTMRVRVRTIDLPGGQGEKKTTHVYADGAACITEYDSTASEGATRERWFVHGPSFPNPLVMVDLTAMGDVAAGTEEYLYYLKDLLGSVTALANSNGAVVERYVYDPYGKTTIETPTFYHDADLDGDVDEADEAHFEACFDSSGPLCVFVHDRNGNDVIDVSDYGPFGACFTTNGVAPGPNCARWNAAYFDPDGDGDVDLYDFGGFQECLGATDDVCLFVYDQDGDADVDLDDYDEFNAHVGTSGVPHPVVADASRYGNPFLWTGQRYDGAVGLYHFLFRSYSPDLGRWLQRDPLGYVDGANLHEYVGSDPLGWIDPLGGRGVPARHRPPQRYRPIVPWYPTPAPRTEPRSPGPGQESSPRRDRRSPGIPLTPAHQADLRGNEPLEWYPRIMSIEAANSWLRSMNCAPVGNVIGPCPATYDHVQFAIDHAVKKCYASLRMREILKAQKENDGKKKHTPGKDHRRKSDPQKQKKQQKKARGKSSAECNVRVG